MIFPRFTFNKWEKMTLLGYFEKTSENAYIVFSTKYLNHENNK
jgi:hypothetical protein